MSKRPVPHNPMRVSLLFAFGLVALVLAPEASAQRDGTLAWYQIYSRSGSTMVRARAITTHTDGSGRTRVRADREAIRTDGPVVIVPLGTGDAKPPEPPPESPSSEGSYGGGVVTIHNSGKTHFISWSSGVKFEGRNVVRMADISANNRATTSKTTTTSNGDGSTSSTTTTSDGGGEEGGGETGGGETEGGETGGDG